jgi:hypothetical protein
MQLILSARQRTRAAVGLRRMNKIPPQITVHVSRCALRQSADAVAVGLPERNAACSRHS